MTDDTLIMPADTPTGSVPMEMAVRQSGIELFRMMIAGELPPPPIAKTMNILLSEAEEGRVIFRGIPRAEHYNPLGTIHGGWPATILDSALGCCVHTMLPAGMAYTTIEFKVNLVRPLFESSGEVICEGRVIHVGRTIATSEATLKTSEGKLIAHGSETCAIFPVGSKG